jgi:hypothetical protein
LATFFHSGGYVLILTENGLGYILVDFSQTHLDALPLVSAECRISSSQPFHFGQMQQQNNNQGPVWPNFLL